MNVGKVGHIVGRGRFGSRAGRLSLSVSCALLALTFPAVASAACSFKTNVLPELQQIVDLNGGYPISDEQCLQLNKENLRLAVSGDAAVINGISVGWVDVTVEDVKTGVTSNLHAKGTAVNGRRASSEESERLLYEALKVAMAGLDVQKALPSIRNR